jgi:hypothetical protein
MEVQRRILEMKEFEDASRAIQAKLFSHHGARNAMLGECGVARQMFLRAIRANPFHLTAYVLLGLGLLGDRALQCAVLKRRQMMSGEINRLITGTSTLPGNLQRSGSHLAAELTTTACALAEGGCRG